MNAFSRPDDAALLKAMREAMASPSEDIARTVLAAAGVAPDELSKTITTGTGLVAYDLQAPAKNLYPVQTPLRNMIPRVPGGIGTATNWRQVNAIIGSGYDAMGWVPEGQRSGAMSYSTSNKAAAYATLGEEDGVTFEAINAGRGFEDVQATMTMRLLQKVMLKEEFAILGGNASLQLGTPAAPTLSAAGSGATLPTATYSVIVVALTFEGVKNSSLTAGVATSKTITGADGKTFTLSGGSSNKSTNATQAITLGQTLSASVTPIQGALGYAWYVGTAGSETLQAITTAASASFAAPLAGGRQAASAVTADNSTNSTAFDGLLTAALKSGSGAYVKDLANGTLTSSGRGSVVELDDMMQAMWDNYQLSVSVFLVNSQQARNITDKCLINGSGNLLNYFQDPKAGEYRLTAGGVVEFYFNPFLNKKVPIVVHPYAVPGTILGWANDLPIQYQNSEVPNVAEVKERASYYAIDWPLATRQRTRGVYAEEVLAVYAPFAMSVLGGIKAG